MSVAIAGSDREKHRSKRIDLRRFAAGLASTARLLLTPLGKHAARFHKSMQSEERLRSGLIIVLPGIDGHTTVSDNVSRGLFRAGTSHAVEIHDWRWFPGWNPLHLCTYRNNVAKASGIAQRIREYRKQFPGGEIHLIGHSAGAGMALFTLRELPDDQPITSVVLLAAAVSRDFSVQDLANRTTHGIWNFSSRADLPAVGLGTLIFGTMDRRHVAAAGAFGFRGEESNKSQLREIRYSLPMVRHWHFGGHFGCTNVAFVSHYVAPIISGAARTVSELSGRN